MHLYLAALILLPVVLFSRTHAVSVNVNLKAPFLSDSILIESLEFIASNYPTLYFPFLSRFSSAPSSTLTPSDQYNSILNHISSLELPNKNTTLGLLKLSLSLREYAPRVEAFWEYYNQVETRFGVDNLKDGTCQVWVDLNGIKVCKVDEIENVLSQKKALEQPDLLPIDHIYSPPLVSALPTAILYTSIPHPDFGKFHKELEKRAKKGTLNYVVRYKPSKVEKESSEESSAKKRTEGIYISGYGVELAIKKTDYLVVDDRKVASDKSSGISAGEQLNEEEDELLAGSTPAIKKLSEDEIKDLPLKTAVYIATSNGTATKKLKTLSQVSQNFPKYAHLLSSLPSPSAKLSSAAKSNKDRFKGLDLSNGDGFWVNGISLPKNKIQPFFLGNLLRLEARSILSLCNLGLSVEDARQFLSGEIEGDGKGENDEEEEGLEVFDTRFDGITWLNNLEKDSRYKPWPSTVRDLLRPVFPGQLRYIGKNIFNTVFMLDLSTKHGLEIFEELVAYIKRGVPIRFGVVVLADHADKDGDANIALRVFQQVFSEAGRVGVSSFFPMLLQKLTESTSPFRDTLKQVFTSWSGRKSTKSFEEVLNDPEGDKLVENVKSYMDRLGLEIGKGKGVYAFMNGIDVEVDEYYIQKLLRLTLYQTTQLQQLIYDGTINDSTDFIELLLSPSGVNKQVYPRRNKYIFSGEKSGKWLDLAANSLKTGSDAGKADEKADVVRYISTDSKEVVPISIWVITDLTQKVGMALAVNALKSLNSEKSIHRIAIVHVPAASTLSPSTKTSRFLKLYHHLTHSESPQKDTLKCLISVGESIVSGGNAKDENCPKFKETAEYEKEVNLYWNKVKLYIQKLGIEDGNWIVVNGRSIGPITSSRQFIDADFELLASVENAKRTQKLSNLMKGFKIFEGLDASQVTSLIPKLSSIQGISKNQLNDEQNIFYPKLKRNKAYIWLKDNSLSFEVGDKKTALFEIVAAIDPVSEIAQTWAPILETLSSIDGVYVKIILLPDVEVTEISLKRFYRYVIQPELQFTSSGAIQNPSAKFDKLPVDPLYTLALDVHQKWHTAPVISPHDLDNIQLSKLSETSFSSNVEATFELQSILLEGHCRESATGSPPRGLQFILESEAKTSDMLNPENKVKRVDTIVMANLGYFQLKANPGIWYLKLREGRSTELYDIVSVGDNAAAGQSGSEEGKRVRLILDSFEGSTILPIVSKKPGKEQEDILDTTKEKESGLWDSIKSTIFGESDKSANRTINVFSVASGHLYERFMSIMFLSVLQHTKNPVKFWLIENFLSPSFRDFLPHMAKEFNFQYEFVTYKWPSWLRAQTEKQRIIWGYKILFLDVLFPLDLDKVIFVDADQIVRTDLLNLLNIDLQGAPYGYTPFCDSRDGMDEYRFWKTGYWKNHLDGKPYHISALYVVDLIRFRQLAAGDRLRGQYHTLSADPNSLANLDQDLPNNMQHEVPIFSLPKEWLWCETWCDDQSLKKAKTIDLCNNPKTKEPKLERARRLLPEWVEYDQRVSDLAKKIKESSATSETKQPQSKRPGTSTPGREEL